MRWSEALHVAPPPVRPDGPVTIAHQSGSYQDVYKTYTYIYPAGSGTGYRTARTSVVQHVLNEFDLNDNGWYAPAVFRKKRQWFAWLSCFFRRFHLQGKKQEERA